MSKKIDMVALSDRFENHRNFPKLPTGKTVHPNGSVWYFNMNTQALFAQFCNGYMARMEDDIKEKSIAVSRMKREKINDDFLDMAAQCIDVDWDHTERFTKFESMNTLDYHIIANGLKLTSTGTMGSVEFDNYTNSLNL